MTPPWKTAKLVELCEQPQYGFTASADFDANGPRFLRITDLKGGSPDWTTVPRCQCPPDEIGKYRLHDGDVVIARIGATTGRTAFIKNPPEAVFASYLIRLRAKPGLDPEFFFFCTCSEHFVSFIDRHKDGNLKGGVNASILAEAPIPLPALAEQRAIAALLAEVQAAVETETERLRVARELKQAALAEVFTRGLRGEGTGAERESWPVVSLGSLAKIGNGSTPRRSDHRYWSGGKIPWLTSGKIHEGVIYAADQFVTELAVRECHLPRVPAGSLLVAITGQGKTLGNVAKTEIETCISQHLAYITLTESAHPDFFRYFLSSRYDDLRAAAHGMGSTKGALTCAFLKSFMVPCPNPDEQRDVAALFRGIDVRIARHEARQKLLRELFASLLRDLMTGRRRVVEVTP